MIKIKNFLKILLGSFFSLLFLLFLTIFGYYLITREYSNDYIPKNTVTTIKMTSIKNIYSLISENRFKNLFFNNMNVLNLIKNLKDIDRRKSPFFKKLLQFFDSPAVLAIDKKNRPLIILDVGWKTLLLSGSVFAIKSVYTQNRNFILDQREINTSSHNLNLYRIRNLKNDSSLYLLMTGNLVLLSQNPKPIINSVIMSAQNNKKLSYKKTAQHVNSNFLTYFSKPGSIINWINSSGPGYKKIFRFKDLFSYFGFGINFQPHGISLNGVLTISEKGIYTNKSITRLFESNHYQAEGFSLVPDSYSYGAFIMFDDLHEFYNQYKLLTLDSLYLLNRINTKRSIITNATGSSMKELLFDWTGNELGFYINNGIKVLLLKIMDPDKAKKAMTKLKLSGHIFKNKPFIYKNAVIRKIRVPFYLKFISSIFNYSPYISYYTMFDDYLIISDRISEIKKLIDSSLSRKTIKFSKVFKNNFSKYLAYSNALIFWNSKGSALPFYKYRSSISRILSSCKNGLIRIRLENSFVKFRVNLFD